MNPRFKSVCEISTPTQPYAPNSKNMFIGENCPNNKTYDKVFVEEKDCVTQCGSESCSASGGGLIFDSWNDGSSCGMQEGQEVWVGCDYVYVMLEDCLKECAPYSTHDSCSTNTSIYFVSRCISCSSAGGGALPASFRRRCST